MVYERKKINLMEIERIEICAGNSIQGILTYFEQDENIHIVSINASEKDKGIGTRLIKSMIQIAKERGKKNIWVETTNDNCRAMEFYQKLGFDLYDIQRHEVSNQRKIKTNIPQLGHSGIPIKHIIRFRMVLE